MYDQLRERHVDLYHHTSEADYERAVRALRDRIPALSTNEVLVEFAKIVALAGDGHTSFYPGDQKRKEFCYLPIQLWLFSRGIFVIGAEESHAELIGKRVTSIDSTSVEEAYDAIATTIGADNPQAYAYVVPFEMIRPELLEALGIADNTSQVTFGFSDGTEAVLDAISLKAWQKATWISANPIFDRKPLPSRRLEALFATSLTLDHLRQRHYYWWEYLPDDKAVFLQYNVSWDQRDRPTLAEMTDEILDFTRDNEVERLIIDVRQNTGGEPLTAAYLVDSLAERSRFADEGRIFVLVGRRTFSAALTTAAHLRQRAKARMVGEYPRGKPNHPSEGRDVDLDRTNIWLSVSTEFVERDPTLGDSPYLPLDVEIDTTMDDYLAGRDRVLEIALTTDRVP